MGLLYSFGSSIRTFAACDGDGPYTLVPGAITLSPRTTEISRPKPPAGVTVPTGFGIVSVVWAGLVVSNATVYNTLYRLKANGTAVKFTNSLMGIDALPNQAKSGVVWYTEDGYKTFNSIHAKEDGSKSF
jgi:hypothetical protein